MKLNESTIKAIEAALTNKKSLEIRIEKNKVVLIELNRKVIDKSPYADWISVFIISSVPEGGVAYGTGIFNIGINICNRLYISNKKEIGFLLSLNMCLKNILIMRYFSRSR